MDFKSMNYLGLDYGKARVGVAVAEGPLAQPLVTLDTQNAIRLIKELVIRYKIDSIVIGDCPQEFLSELQIFKLPVIVTDDTLSSHDAREGLLHTTQKRRKNLEHQASATIILQSWLDYHD